MVQRRPVSDLIRIGTCELKYIIADLVRNNIFHRAEQQGASVEELYAELWQPFEEPFWKMDAPRARPVRPRIEHFLSHALTAQTGSATSMRELYAEYRSFAKPKGQERFANVAEELAALTRFVPTYRTLEADDLADADLHWFGRKLAAWEVTTSYPAAFQLATSVADPSERKRSYALIYSYVVRRGMCELGAKNLNNVFQRVVSQFLKEGTSYDALAALLLEMTGSAGRFPTDAELTEAIIYRPVYGRLTGQRLPDILWELELASRTSKMEALPRPDGLWVEHIMPRSWSAHWPLPSGEEIPNYSSEPAQAEEIATRDRLINTLGNLTPTTSSLNISLGNENFDEKRKKLRGNTLLALNEWLAGHGLWNEEMIIARGRHLAELALRIWPRPG